MEATTVRLPLLVQDFADYLKDRGLIPPEGFVRRVTIVADASEAIVQMTVEMEPDTTLLEALACE